jgi:hypothetical protein
MNAIETHRLTKYYGKSRGIVDLDPAVEEGEILRHPGGGERPGRESVLLLHTLSEVQ